MPLVLAFIILAAHAAPDSSLSLVRLDPADYPHFMDNGDPGRLAGALRDQLDWFDSLPTGTTFALGESLLSGGRVRHSLERFLELLEDPAAPDLNRLIRSEFEVYALVRGTDTGSCRFTGYYNPELPARLEPDSAYRYPLYRYPGTTMPRWSREQIEEQDVLRGHEIAWLRDPFDRYAVQIEGSATLVLPGSTRINAHYAGWNRHPYTSLGRVMINDGLLSPDHASMDDIRDYFARHPERLQEYLNRNRSYCFFRLDTLPPLGCLRLPLVAERSVALDHSVFPAGGLFFAVTRIPAPDTGGHTEPWYRFVLNHDRGAAIRGDRADIYWGTGPEAKRLADRLNAPGRLYCLVVGRERP